MEKIKVAIAENDESFRNSLESILLDDPDIVVAMKTDLCKELLLKINHYKPQVLLADISIEGMEALLRSRSMTENYPQIKVIALSPHPEEDNILAMFRAGVKSFLSRADLLEIPRIVKIISQQGTYWTDSINLIIQKSIKAHPIMPFKLSEFELSFIKELSQGKSCTELGEIFFRSPRTIEKYRETLYEKFRVDNKEQLIAMASKYSLL